MTDHVRPGTDLPAPDELPFRSGTPTSVGSLPHADRAAAVAFELDRHPELPAVPTLPAAAPLESMLVQAAWGLAGVSFAADGALVVEPSELDPDAPTGDAGLTGAPFATWRHFCAALGEAEPRTDPVKLQLTGPVTLGLALVDAGAPVDLAFRTAARAVGDRARALLALARTHVPVAPLLVMLDEPGLAGGLRADLPIDADATIDLLSGALAAIESDAIGAVHCCGPADWRLLVSAGPRVVSMPVGAGATAAAGTLAEYLDAGGWIAWGAVPTAAPLGDRAARYWKLLSGQWCELVRAGCDPVLLRRQAMLTPECGLALHDVDQAAHVFDLVRELSNRMHDQALGVRLSVGA